MVFSLKTITLGSILAALAVAAPSGRNYARQDSTSFTIRTHNNCSEDHQFALYQVTSSYQMIQMTTPVMIPANGGHAPITAPFHQTGMRLSATAGQGTAAQWNAQALFEFGYTAPYSGSMSGTAYDLSVMQGSNPDIGISVKPVPNGTGSQDCESKICFPDNCPAAQGWTNPDQVNQGSPADTVCYHGPTDFIVTFCPTPQ